MAQGNSAHCLRSQAQAQAQAHRDGVARFYARAGVEHFRKNPDGSSTKLEPSFHDLVIYGKAAEQAYRRYRVGDSSVAAGYVQEYGVDVGGHNQQREEFVARRIGHDTLRTRYGVERGKATPPDPAPAPAPERSLGI